ncbi:HeH/LEM domain-containing protein [Pseudomonas mediterranea]|uniref:HeH/LEM domain-containing protein n=1 Tax=Pseudomonas mediterranea TaxID=183795 RepID=UPI0006D89A03|nr:HeH/LEM domain-containing protein [Pseudomonas mediterranea]
MEIHYEPHPVLPERKAELRGQGLRIIDSRFQPTGAQIETISPTREELDSALSALPGDHTNPEYVIKHMRTHFGELFTDGDESLVRERVKESAKKPSDGLKVDDLKAALDAKGIAYLASASKPDLQKLLDEAE